MALNGLPQFLAAWMLFKKHPWACWAVFICGIILMFWIVLEWWAWGFNAMSNIFFFLGLAETIFAAICLRRS